MMNLVNSIPELGNAVLAWGPYPDPYECDLTMNRAQYDTYRQRYPLFGKYFAHQLDCATYDPPFKTMFSTRDEETLLAQLRGNKPPRDGAAPVNCEAFGNAAICKSLETFLEKEVEDKVERNVVMTVLMTVLLALSSILLVMSYKHRKGQAKGDGGCDKGDGPTDGGSSGSGKPRELRSIKLPRRNSPVGWQRGRAPAPIRTPFRPLR
jgi:hypothetical protein